MFEYKGGQYTYEDLQAEAKKQGVDFAEFMGKMKKLGMTSVKNTTEGQGPNLDMSSQQPFEQDQTDLGFTDKLSNIFEPVIPGIQNLFEQTFSSGLVALDNAYKTMLPKGGILSDLVESAGKKLMIDPDNAEEFDAGTLVDQLLYVTGDYDGDVKFIQTDEEKETMSKIARGEKDILGSVLSDQQDIIDKRLEGKGGYTGEGFFNSSGEDKLLAGIGAMVGVVSTVVPAILTRGASLGPQIIAPMISDYNKEKANYLFGEDDPDALKKLSEADGFEIGVPAVLGYVAYSLEKMGFKGITNYMFKQSFKPGRFVSLIQTGHINGVQEALQGLVGSLNSKLANGENKLDALKSVVTDDLFSEKFLEDYTMGLAGGVGMSGSGAVINRALKSDERTSLKITNFVDQLAGLRGLRAVTESEDALEGIDAKIKATEEEFADYVQYNNSLGDYLSVEQETELKSILESKDKNNLKLDRVKRDFSRKKISEKELDLITEQIKAQQEKDNAAVYKIKTDANAVLLKSDLDAGTSFIGDVKGLEQEVYKTNQEFLDALVKEYKAKGKKVPSFKDVSIYGVKIGNKLLINAQVAAEQNAVATSTHEIIHGIVKSSIQENDGSGNLSAKGVKIINSFINQLSGKEKRLVEKTLDDAGERTNKDGSQRDFKEYGEEYLAVYAQLSKEGKFTKNGIQQVGNWISSLVRKESAFKKISFEDGKSTKAFLDAFVGGDKTAIEQAKALAREGVEMKETIEFSKESTNAINELGKVDKDGNNLEEKGTGNFYYQAEADDIVRTIEEKGYLDGLIRSKYKAEKVPPNFVKQVMSELSAHIKAYKPERKNESGLFGWINSQISNKANAVYNREYKVDDEMKGAKDIGKTTKEGEVKVQVAAETDSRMEALETEDLSPAAQAKKKADKARGKEKVESKFRRQIGIETGSDLYNKVLDTARKSLLRAYEAGTSVRNIQRKLRDEANVYLFKDIKNFLGTTKYISNLKEFRVPIMNSIFTADLVQMERNTPEGERVFTRFVRKLTSKEDVQAAVDQNLLPASALNIIDKGTAVSLYEKANPTEAQFMSYFDIPTINPKTGARSGTRGTRKDQLAKNMAGALSYDATMEVAQEPGVIIKRDQLAALKGETLAQDDLQVLASTIGRDANVKFSRSNENRIVSNMALEITELLDAMVTNPTLVIKTKDGYKLNSASIIKRWTKGSKFAKSDEAIIAEFAYKTYRSNEYGKLTDVNLQKKVLRNVIKARKNKFDLSTHQAFEQLVISSLQYANRKAGNVLKTNKKVKEGVGEGDAYISSGRIIVGIEVKMNEADGVSQTVNPKDDGSVSFTNSNPITNEKGNTYDSLMGDMISKAIKDLGIELGGITNFKLTETQMMTVANNLLKTKYLQVMDVSAEYAMWHYGNGKYTNKPQGFIHIGEATYRMVTGNDAIDKVSLAIAVEYKSNTGVKIESLALREGQTMEMVGRLKIDKTTGKLNYRISPRIVDKQLVGSKVNLLNKTDAVNFMKAATTAIAKFSRSQDAQTLNNAIKFSRSTNNPTKGITVLDFDDTLATSKSLIRFTRPDGTKGTLNAEQYASTYENLSELGYKFDFSEFTKVVDGKTAPLFNKAMKLQGKFGPENMFVLTARPAESAPAIHAFLKANGLNIPLKNITGLANSTAESKALWMADKVGEGYNDFYFADDALQNVKAVQNMLNQLDVKSKVQQAKVKFSKSMNEKFNDILENVTGIDSVKRFSEIKGRKRGDDKGKFRLFIPPSHEDFVGLLYNFMGKGKEGNKHRDFFEQALVRPINRAYREIDTAKQAIANDYKALNEKFPDIKDKLIKTTPDGDFTFSDAIRVYLWNKHGHKIPGLTETDQAQLTELVQSDPQLQAYAETLNVISKQETYVAPGQAWEMGNIRIDLVDATGRVGRAEYFSEFQENAEVIFSEENLNKIEASYGKDFREALEDMLHRIKTGVNRPKGASAKPNMFMNWLNASVSGVMFFNTRSALLQQMSNVNYLNFADNNIFKAGLAFANQKQYWADFAMIFNSDMLKQRRGGLGTDINGAELAEAIKKARPDSMFDQVSIIVGKALKLGFLPTQIGDNIAIATGGAAFYRNRVNKYIKDGMNQKEAENAAFTDFQNITQSTQQSARPDMTSQQQASWIGKLVLNFLNTPSQYNRIIKKAALDIKNRRITGPNTNQTQSDMSNMSRILYYGAAQNLIFYSLQTALFAVMFGDDEEDNEAFLKKKERVINGSIDTILRGSGIYGVAVSTLKNMAIKFMEQREKGYNKDESAVALELANFSPVLGIKFRRIVNAEKTINYNGKVIEEMETFDLDNPAWSAVTNYTQSLTGAPVNKIYQKTINLRNASDNQYTALQRILFLSGYTTWSLNLGDTDKMEGIKQDIKDKKKKSKKKKSKKNRFGPTIF